MMDGREIAEYAALLALLLFCIVGTLRASKLLRQRSKGLLGTASVTDRASPVSLVALPVVVTDRRGQLVSGLKQDDFLVFEDGKPQAICAFREEDLPVSVGLVVDSSESMRLKRREVTQAAISFVERSNRDDEIFVVNFNDQVSLGLPANIPFTNDIRLLEDAVRKSPPEGETALYDAVLAALKHVQLGTRERRSLVIISDGDDNASRSTFDQLLAAAETNGVLIYALAVFDSSQIENDAAFLTQLAKVTGGNAYLLNSATELPELGPQIARELRSQYTLLYSPSNTKRDGAFRTIRVVAQTSAQGKLFVRTRTGYRAALDSVGVAEPGATSLSGD
jgi:Ca-activated chloride channel homolog